MNSDRQTFQENKAGFFKLKIKERVCWGVQTYIYIDTILNHIDIYSVSTLSQVLLVLRVVVSFGTDFFPVA